MAEQVTPSNAEIVGSFLNVLCKPLGRAIVDELQDRGLAVPIDRDKLTDSRAEVDRLKGVIERLETEAREYREMLSGDRRQADKMLSRIEMLRAQLADKSAVGLADTKKPAHAAEEEVKRLRTARESGRETLIPLVAPRATCETCCWWSGKVCQRQGCKWVNHHRGAATPACEKYVFTQIPRGRAIAQVGEGIGTHRPVKPVDERIPEIRKRAMTPDDPRKGPKRRAVCPACHTEHAVNKLGECYPHDVHGVEFRAGRGDRSRRCSGKKK